MEKGYWAARDASGGDAGGIAARKGMDHNPIATLGFRLVKRVIGGADEGLGSALGGARNAKGKGYGHRM